MAIEQIRGCGYRKVNGLYLVGEGLGMACDRLPYELKVCSVCGSGVKFSRGFQWLDWARYAGDHSFMNKEEKCSWQCPVCHPEGHPQPYGLLWCGEQFYSPQSFIQEAIEMGVSKRIAAIPKNLKLGETCVLFAHKKAVMRPLTPEEMDAQGYKLPADVPEGQTYEGFKVPEGQVFRVYAVSKELPGVFYAFRPQRLELLIWQSEATNEKLTELEKKSITPIIIPDGDIDHDPSTKLRMTEEERAGVERSRLFSSLRNNLGR